MIGACPLHEIKQFEDHINQCGLNHSQKRVVILNAFLNAKRHVSAEELHQLVKQKDRTIGYTTVYRTLKLIVESGLAQAVDFDDGVKRFERKMGREYHAHFICTGCGHHFEVFDVQIQELAAQLAGKKGFAPKKHRYEIFGLCKDCRK